MARVDRSGRNRPVPKREPVDPTAKKRADKGPQRPLDPNSAYQATGKKRQLPKSGGRPRGSNATNVRLDNLVYKASEKHHAGIQQGGYVSEAPKNGQAALDASIQIKPTSPRRIAVDPAADQLVVFDRTLGDEYHGHVRTWEQLSHQMQSVLRKHQLVNSKGKIRGAERCATKSPSPSPWRTPSLALSTTTPRWSPRRWFAWCTARWTPRGSRPGSSPRLTTTAPMCARSRRPVWVTWPASIVA